MNPEESTSFTTKVLAIMICFFGLIILVLQCFINKINETLKLGVEILRSPLSKDDIVQELLKIQCSNALGL